MSHQPFDENHVKPEEVQKALRRLIELVAQKLVSTLLERWSQQDSGASSPHAINTDRS